MRDSNAISFRQWADREIANLLGISDGVFDMLAAFNGSDEQLKEDLFSLLGETHQVCFDCCFAFM
jgi:hypothetical protein